MINSPSAVSPATSAPLTLLRSPVLEAIGVPHAFTTRHAGVSSGLFASLNFGNPSDLDPDQRDPISNIRANLALVADALGAPSREIIQVHQVHGGEVLTLRRGSATPAVKADAIVTDDPARLAVVRVADCAPVLIASGDGRVVASVHAGWRGTVGKVIRHAIDAMRSLGAADLAAAVGPCIGADHFEIGPEVVVEFRRALGDDTAHVRPARRVHPDAAADRSLVDLKSALREQLVRAGVVHVDVLSHCTFADSALFFSHRRDRGRTGRMIGIIGPRAG